MGPSKLIWDLLKETFKEWQRDNASRLAAAIAFYTIFSLAPVLMIALAIAGGVTGEAAARSELASQIRFFIGPRASEFILLVLEGTRGEGSGSRATILGLVTAFLGATVAFSQLQDALNTIWDVKPKGSWIKGLIYSRLLSFGVVLGIGLLLLLSLVLSAAFSVIDEFVGYSLPVPGLVLDIADLAISFALITVLFAVIYKVLPDVQISWSDVWVGAAITSLLFTVGKTLIGFYLGSSSLRSVYGAAGSLVLILLWVYYSAQIFFFGAELTQVYARRHGSQIKPAAHAERIS